MGFLVTCLLAMIRLVGGQVLKLRDVKAVLWRGEEERMRGGEKEKRREREEEKTWVAQDREG